MTVNSRDEPNGRAGGDDGDGGPIVENSTIENATVVIHSHLTQQPVDIVTDSINVQVLVDECYLNGVEYMHPIRSLTIENVRVTHDPREGVLSIRT